MSVLPNSVLRRYNNVAEGVPIVVNLPLFAKSEVGVFYSEAGLLATLNVDYTLDLNEVDYSNFTITPLLSLIDKINAQIAAVPTDRNTIVAIRILPYATTSTPPSARNSDFASREFDRIAMEFQQVDEGLGRTVMLSIFNEDVGYDLTLPDWVADEVLAWHPTLKKLVTLPLNLSVTQTLTDADPTMAANSDARVPTQKAAKSYIDAAVTAAIATIRGGVTAAFDTLAEVETAINAIVANNWVTTVRILDGAVTFAKVATAAKAAAGEFMAGTVSKLLTVSTVWADAAETALTDAATIVVNLSLFLNAATVVLGGNRTLGNPTNHKGQQAFTIWVTATGGTRTLALGANYKKSAAVEAFPISVLTTETVGVHCIMRSSTVCVVTGVTRYTT